MVDTDTDILRRPRLPYLALCYICCIFIGMHIHSCGKIIRRYVHAHACTYARMSWLHSESYVHDTSDVGEK